MASYDPSKEYQWPNDDQIIISGRDFGLFLNTFRAILESDLAVPILMANRANIAIEAVMSKYIENGTIKEVEQKMEIVK